MQTLELLPPGAAEIGDLRNAKPPEEDFAPFVAEADEVMELSAALTVTDISQTDRMAAARNLRLRLRELRVKVEKLHKERKVYFLEGGRKIDALKNKLVPALQEEEARLLAAEQFRERAEQAARDALQAERTAALAPYALPGMAHMPLASLSEAEWCETLDGAKAMCEARQQKADAERQAREAVERAAAEQQARVRAENERLRMEAAVLREKEAVARREVEAAAAKERERTAAEARMAEEREAAARRETARAATAPDAGKLAAVQATLAEVHAGLQRVQVSSPAGMEVMTAIRARVMDAERMAARAAQEMAPPLY